MILIITLNPLLERRFYFHKINYEAVNRNGKVVFQAGGKGINVSRQLKQFGIDSYNLFFSGGNDGKIYRDVIKQEGLQFSSVHINSETRQAAVVVSESDKKVLYFFSENPVITKSEVDEMKTRIQKMIINCEMVVVCGSSPSSIADEIVPFTISLANELDKVSIIDYYGSNLNDVINSAPTMLHNNFNEMEISLGVKLKSEQDIQDLFTLLYSKGIKRVFLTNGEKEFYAQNFDYRYKVIPPKVDSIDSTGSGDAFVAGIIYSWKNGYVFDESLKFATACGALNSSSFEVCKITLQEILSLKDNVVIQSIGKRMKIIDDSPHQE